MCPEKSIPDQNEKLLLSVEIAAVRLSLSVKSVRRLVNQGRLKRVPYIGRVLIPVTELERFARTLE